MPFVPMPDSVVVPDMIARDRDPSTWTLQPGTNVWLHSLVVGAAPGAILPLAEQTAEAHVVEVPMASSGGGATVKLRDYQLEAIDAVHDAWARGAKAPLIVLPTASGKTLISAEIMARIYKGSGGKSLFIAHRDELLTQTMDKVRLVSPDTRVGLVQAKTNEVGREITVASIQTIGHKGGARLKKLLEHGPYSAVVIDEAHHAVGSQYMKVIAALREANPNMLLMGMSVGPDSYVELRGGAFTTGFVGRIEDAWDLAVKTFALRQMNGFDIVDLHGVEARGWSGNGFVWKTCRRLLRHHVLDTPCSEVATGGKIGTVLTNDHAVYVAKGERGHAPHIATSEAADLRGAILVGDNGAEWNSRQTVESWDMIEFARRHMRDCRVYVSCNVKRVPRERLREIGLSPQKIYDARKASSLPLASYVELGDDAPPAISLRVAGSSFSCSPTIACESLAFVLGVWLGDGWIDWERTCSDGRGRLGFAVANHQVEAFRKALDRMPLVPGVCVTRRNKGSVEVRVSNMFLAALCRRAFGRVNSASKRIPSEWIISWPESARRELLRGLLFSDGSTQRAARGRVRRQYKTVCRWLAHDILSLLRSLGIPASLDCQQPRAGGTIDGRLVRGRRVSYMVHWSANTENGYCSGRRGERRRFDHSTMSFHERHVRQVAPVDCEKRSILHVFDMEMDGHPSFVVNGVLVHNTATPGRSDGIALDRVFDVVAYEKNMFEMIRDGWLVPPHGFRVDIDIDLDKVETGDGDYVITQLSKLMNTPHVNRAVVEAWRTYGHDRKCIVFACDVAHSHALAQEFIDAGHPAAAVDGKMKDKDRKEVLNRFREGSIKLLVNCQIATEGYDDPSTEGIVFARPTQSQGLYIQCLDYQTEILTKRGWVGPQTVRDDDIVATMDPDTERCVWSPILSRVDRPMHEREKMYALKLPGIDIRVTGNHRMIYKQRRNKKPMWTVASQIPKCFTAIVSVAEPEGTQDCPGISDADLTLLGWWYAEGSWNRANNALVLYQGVRSRFVNEIEHSLRECGLKFGRQRKKYDTEFKKNHEMFVWYVSYGTPRGTHKDKRGWKYLDRWINRDGTKKPTVAFHDLSARQWRVFLEAFNKGDGARLESASIDWKPQTWNIYQKPGSGLHDMFQALCLTRGMRCNLSEHANSRGRGFSRLSIAPDKRYHTINGSRPELTMREVERAPDERVWCVETSTGTIITRRNGKAAVVGNCIGRGLRLYPGKTECLVIDCVGNSEKHRPVQLASLAGFDPERKYSGRGKGLGDSQNFDDDPEETTEVTGAKVGDATEVTFGVRKPKSQYQWRETTLGWILQIPRIGYYLVAWSDKAKHMATIRFFDQRAGRKHEPPREIVRQPVEFDMAYGLVESEMDRIFRARSMRRDDAARPDDDQPVASFVDLDEGTDEDIVLPEEELMLKDAGWRERPVSLKQRDLLLSLGVKERTMPGTAGEASDLITIMRVERDMKMRVPATLKQINYLKYHGLPLGENLTKGMAARAIWMHRKATGR